MGRDGGWRVGRESRKSLVVPAAVRIGQAHGRQSGRWQRSTAVRRRLGGRSSRELRSLGTRTRQGREETGRGVGLVERLKDDARVDWSRMACQSVSLRSVGRASLSVLPLRPP